MQTRFKGVVAAVLAVAAIGCVAAPAAGAKVTHWSQTATRATQLLKATRLRALPKGTRLQVAVALKLHHSRALQAFTASVGRPGSRNFDHYLTPAKFRSLYAPTRSQSGAVERYLRGRGFTHVSVTSNRLFVTGEANAGQVERAFHTSLSLFSRRGRDVFVNTSAAEVPRSLSATVLSVLGLNDIHGFTFPLQTKPYVKPALSDCQLDPASSNDLYGLCEYQPSDFRLAYDTGAATGASTGIAIMAEGDLTQVIKDLRQAEAAFNEPQVPVSIIRVGTPSTDTSGADEWDLDTQYSSGIARSVKRLYVYDTTSLTDSDIALEFNKWAAQDLAKGGSASFGECESLPYVDGSMLADDQVLNEAAAQGQTMHASSGDTGGESCAVAPTNGVPESGAPNVNYPCSSPYLVCVGGTSLFTNADGSYDEELGWYAGGGGVSALEYSPEWQSCVVPSNAGSDRGAPDISMDADANTGADVYVDGTPEGVGGTSLSSPLALGSWAVIETANKNRLGFASPLLYSLYPTSSCVEGANPQTGQLGTSGNDPSYPLHDVYLGANGALPTTFGWDYVTGLGTYDIAAAAKALGALK